MIFEDVVYVLLSLICMYIIGSIPTAYLLGRASKGIDIRYLGSRNVGASNIGLVIGKSYGLSVGIFDCLIKGTLPIVILRNINVDDLIILSAALLLIVGHNWSPFVGFKGGRGVAIAIGIIIGMSMWVEMFILVAGPGLLGRFIVYKDSGLWTLVSMILLVCLTVVLGREFHIILLAIGTLLLLLSKRLIANGEPISKSVSIWQIFVCRLVLDRDIPSRVEWITRQQRASL